MMYCTCKIVLGCIQKQVQQGILTDFYNYF